MRKSSAESAFFHLSSSGGKKEPISPKLAKLKKILCGYDISSEYKLAPGLNSNYNTINYETNKAI